MKDRLELTGLFPEEIVRARTIERPDPDLIARFQALGDLTGNVSDAMDAAGIEGVIPAAALPPLQQGSRIVGPAITVRSERRPAVAVPGARMGDIEAYNLARPGDVLVVQGAELVSSLGGLSAQLALRQGVLGAVVDGAVRDVASLRDQRFAVWCRGASPATGKHRLRTLEIMGPVRVAGVLVQPGDLVAADDTGICVVPRDRAREVLERAEEIAAREAARGARIAGGESVRDLAREGAPPRKGSAPS